LKYIVTGGAGFIGSHLVGRLLEENHKVLVIDNLVSGNIKNLAPVLQKVEFVPSLEALPDSGFDGVFHLGFPSSSPMYRKNPGLVADVMGDMIKILEYSAKRDIPLVYATTSSIYNGNPTPWREDLPVHVTDFYTEARYAVERLCRLYYYLKQVNSVGLRLFSVYGENEWFKGRYANLVSQFIWAMMRGERPEIYFDGEQRRDFVYQSDVVDCFVKAMNLVSKKPVCEIVNVGTGKNYSLNELVKMINGALGKEIQPIYRDVDIPNYVQDTLADTDKMGRLFGGGHVELSEGVARVISHHASERATVSDGLR
jgi:UDP-glucose 4-epimerase